MLPALGAILIVIGSVMLKRGRWPQRAGQTPHCPKCDYILTTDQTRCPECGTTVGPANIVLGERHRRGGLAFTGVGLALPGVAPIALFASGVVQNIDWIRYKPLSWLLNDLASGRPRVDQPAWGEIQRRIDAGLLSDNDQNVVVEKGLFVQNLTSGTASQNVAILNFIAGRYLKQKLTTAQADQFFAGMLKVNLSARPVVGAKSRLPFIITGTGRGPDGWWMRVRTLESQVDNGQIQRLGGASGGSFGGWSSGSSMPPIQIVGKHQLRVKVEFATDVDRGGGVAWDDNAVVAKRMTQDLFANFEAIEGQTPIATVTAPPAQTLAPLLVPTLTRSPGQGSDVWVNVNTPGLPVDAAFDVLLRIKGKNYQLGSVSFHRGAASGFGTGGRDIPRDAPDKVDVIFRSSEQVARDTIDLTSIWKGEILIPEVSLPKPTTAPAAGSRSGAQP
jgi:hypothetical protein